MQLFTFSGPPSSGKTSVLMRLIPFFQKGGQRVGIVKFDCLRTDDDKLFQRLGIPVLKGLAGELCPDHYFAANIEEAFLKGQKAGLDCLFTESAGLCNRCAPHVKEIPAVCVIDQMAGIDTPQKVGPMLKSADCVIVTKADMVSPAEREVFALNIQRINPRAALFAVNGLTGEGCEALYHFLKAAGLTEKLAGRRLRFPMPMATCSYCLGEQRIGREFRQGNVKQLEGDFVGGWEAGVEGAAKAAAPGEAGGKVSSAGTTGSDVELPDGGGKSEQNSGEKPGAGPAADLLFSAELGATVREESAAAMRAAELALPQPEALIIQPGHDKMGRRESFEKLTIRRGEVVALVGPTGSGKSRLLEDISGLVGADSLTGRRVSLVLEGGIAETGAGADSRKWSGSGKTGPGQETADRGLAAISAMQAAVSAIQAEDPAMQMEGAAPQADGTAPQMKDRPVREVGYRPDHMIAHLSQNMNFVMDLEVGAFIERHLACRFLGKNRATVQSVLDMANELTGEPIQLTDSLAGLSGGQSRALMIADCVLVSPAPIMLIDEIENAGIRKKQAMELLGGRDKIVFLSTHDPVLALMADRRFVIGNGAIQAVLTRSTTESTLLEELTAMDDKLADLRDRLRSGAQLDSL